MDSNEFFTKTIQTYIELNGMRDLVIATGRANYIIRGLAKFDTESYSTDNLFICLQSVAAKTGYLSQIVEAMGLDLHEAEGELAAEICLNIVRLTLGVNSDRNAIHYEVVNGIKCRDTIENILEDLNKYPTSFSYWMWDTQARYTYDAICTLKEREPSMYSKLMFLLNTHQREVYQTMKGARARFADDWLEVEN